MRKKLKNWLNRENRKKNNWKNQTEKKLIKPIKFLKKPAGSVRFGFINKKPKKPNRTETDKKLEKNRAKLEKPSQTKKTEPKPEKTEPKPETPSQTGKTEPNRFEPVFSLKKPNRTETGRFDPVSVFLKKKKISVWLFFFIKTEPNRK